MYRISNDMKQTTSTWNNCCNQCSPNKTTKKYHMPNKLNQDHRLSLELSLGQLSKFSIKFPLTSRQRTGAGDNYII